MLKQERVRPKFEPSLNGSSRSVYSALASLNEGDGLTPFLSVEAQICKCLVRFWPLLDLGTMSPIDLDRAVRVGEDTVFRELAGEAVLLQLEAGMYYGLDPVGTRLWQLLAERGKLRDVFEAAQQEFDVDADTLQHDLLELVATLAEKKLLTFD